MSKIEINGDGNQVFEKIKKSRINSNDNNTNTTIGSTVKWIGIVSLIVAIIGLVLKILMH